MAQARKIAYLDCYSGISGDMFLGALLDAGVSGDTIMNAITALPFEDYEFTFSTHEDKGIRGTQLEVEVKAEQPVRHLSDITSMLRAADLPARAREIALAIFQCLAEAEARVHGTTMEEVHFHEVGAVDALIDIVGAAVGVTALGIEQLYASPLPWTSGKVRSAHGILPVPAPATLEILRRVEAPWRPCEAEGELVTPTGAAILATLVRFETPAIAIERVGYGFGQKRLPWPNCLRLCIGHDYATTDPVAQDADTDWVTVIESHIDNMSGEPLGDLMERLMGAGALDVSYTPLQMKKNRPATMVTVICTPQEGDRFAMLLLQDTTTLGVRIQQVRRLKAQRMQQQVTTPLGTLMVKVKRLGSRVISASPEYEECRRIARERDVPLATVYELADAATRSLITEHE